MVSNTARELSKYFLPYVKQKSVKVSSCIFLWENGNS
jgi:hypothetical protein